MGEAKFTSGEWVIFYPHKLDLNEGYVSVESEDGGLVHLKKTYKRTLKEDTANAHLIAAAPEMYELLERAKEAMLSTYDVTDYPANGKTDCDKCAADIDKLLAKARGEG